MYSDARIVLLDTNILIYSAERPFDIEQQLNAAGFSNIKVPQVVLDELEKISLRGGRRKVCRFAKLALEIAKRFEIIRFKSDAGDADSQLIHAAMDTRYIVATADAAVRRRLRLEGLPVIFPKDGRLTSEIG